jgi:hypothetical protein
MKRLLSLRQAIGFYLRTRRRLGFSLKTEEASQDAVGLCSKNRASRPFDQEARPAMGQFASGCQPNVVGQTFGGCAGISQVLASIQSEGPGAA